MICHLKPYEDEYGQIYTLVEVAKILSRFLLRCLILMAKDSSQLSDFDGRYEDPAGDPLF
jgi:hypothetical protein